MEIKSRVIWSFIKRNSFCLISRYRHQILWFGHRKPRFNQRQVTIDSANAIKKYGVGINVCHHSDESPRGEFGLKKMWKSPNKPSVIFWTGPFSANHSSSTMYRDGTRMETTDLRCSRHAFGDQYRAYRLCDKRKRKLTITFTPRMVANLFRTEVWFQWRRRGFGVYNTDESISGFAVRVWTRRW